MDALKRAVIELTVTHDQCFNSATLDPLFELAPGLYFLYPVPAALAADVDRATIADKQRLVRELDVLLNGEAGAAKQAALCDIVLQLQYEVGKLALYLENAGIKRPPCASVITWANYAIASALWNVTHFLPSERPANWQSITPQQFFTPPPANTES